MKRESSSSSSSSTSYVTSDDEQNNTVRRSPREGYTIHMRGFSDETKLLLHELIRQRRLFEERFSDYMLDQKLLYEIKSILKSHKVRINRVPFHLSSGFSMHAYLTAVRNLPNCLKEIRSLEDKYGNDLWILQFLALHNMLVELHPAVSKVLFRSSVLDVYMKCAEAINKRQWHLIFKYVAGISFSFFNVYSVKFLRKITEDRRKYLHLKLKLRGEPTNFYLTGLFLASVQRHLQLSESTDMTLELIEGTVRNFKGTCEFRLSLWSNPSSFFILNGIIFQLCHGYYEKISQVIESPLLQLEPNWQRAFFVYKNVCDYEVFCSTRNTLQGRTLLSLVDGNWSNLMHKEHGLILLPIIIELCIYLAEGELLFEKMNDICTECPALLSHVCKMLAANGCNDAPLSLFEELITSIPDKLAPWDVTPALLKNYSQDPAKYGPVTEVVKSNLKLAFAVLDFGRNRNNMDAWQSLYTNLRRVESEPEVLNEFWDSRRHWWPRFHVLNEKDECFRIKKKCFKRLDAVIAIMASTSDFYLIEHPGIVKNLDNAFNTLGGKDAINEALSGTKQMDLRYYPDNLYQNGIVAEKKITEAVEGGVVQLVFKIRRKKADPSQCKCECLGLVKTVYSFKTLCDFQYLPIQKHPTVTSPNETVYEDLVPRLVPTNMEASFSWWTHREPAGQKVPSFLPPFLFSRYTTGTQTKILGQESERVVRSGTPVSHGQNLRSERKAFTVTVQGSDEFPKEPTAAAVADVDARIKREEPHKLVKDLFVERPMWSRIAISSRTGLEETTLKVLMAKYGFYILSGPWGRLWCRFGYDPRKNPEAKRYQTVMVSFRKHNQIPERQRLKYNPAERHASNQGVYDYMYRSGMLPAVRQIWYSVCDIELPAAQKILRADFYGTLKECDSSSGWLPAKVIEDIRNAIKEDVHRLSQTIDDVSTIGSPTRSEMLGNHSDNEDYEGMDWQYNNY